MQAQIYAAWGLGVGDDLDPVDQVADAVDQLAVGVFAGGFGEAGFQLADDLDVGVGRAGVRLDDDFGGLALQLGGDLRFLDLEGLQALVRLRRIGSFADAVDEALDLASEFSQALLQRPAAVAAFGRRASQGGVVGADVG